MKIAKKLICFALALLLIGAVSNRGHCGLFRKTPKKVLVKSEQLYEEGKYNEAVIELEKIISKQYSSKIQKKAYWYLGKCYESLSDFDKAVNTYQLAAQLYSKDIPLHLALAGIYYKVGLLDEARSQYKEILEMDKNNFQANVGLAQTYERLGFLRFASDHYKIALQSKSQKSTKLKRDYARCFLKQRRCVEAEDAAQKALRDFKSDPDSQLLLAQVRNACGKKKMALADISKAIDLAPLRTDIAIHKALWLISDGDLKSAFQLLWPMLKREPGNPLVAWTASLAFLKSGKIKQAGKYLGITAANTQSPFIAEVSGKMIEEIKGK
jgi:tetratricopeptide (TPR) repeat protein